MWRKHCRQSLCLQDRQDCLCFPVCLHGQTCPLSLYFIRRATIVLVKSASAIFVEILKTLVSLYHEVHVEHPVHLSGGSSVGTNHTKFWISPLYSLSVIRPTMAGSSENFCRQASGAVIKNRQRLGREAQTGPPNSGEHQRHQPTGTVKKLKGGHSWRATRSQTTVCLATTGPPKGDELCPGEFSLELQGAATGEGHTGVASATPAPWHPTFTQRLGEKGPEGTGEEFYREAIEHCRSYNARLCAERSMRLPFLDSQTGVAQSNCYIWMEKNHRGPGAMIMGFSGVSPGQLYTYPARCWRKKKRLNILDDPRLGPIEFKIDYESALKKEGGVPEGPVLESLLSGESLDKKVETKEEEAMSECQAQILKLLVGDFPHELDMEEMEEDVPKRKNRTKGRDCSAVSKHTDNVVIKNEYVLYKCKFVPDEQADGDCGEEKLPETA
ncbi:zinc finger protein neuro-d4 isoform 2 [Silurus meridionalis]|nr:zinc finger protein neuro-d4 isoform 2 [Silurus meridionalis]